MINWSPRRKKFNEAYSEVRDDPVKLKKEFRESIDTGSRFSHDSGEDKLEKEKKKGNIKRIRTIKPTPETYIKIGVRKRGAGKRGGKTVAGKVHHKKKVRK